MPTFETLPQPSLSKLSDALERAGYIVFVLECHDAKLQIVSLNAAASDVTGHSSHAVAGKPFQILAGGQTDAAALDVFFASARESCPHHARFPCRNRAGQEVWLDLSVIPFPADERSPALLLVFGRDITPVVRQTEQESAIRALLAKVFVTVDVPVYIVDDKGRFLMTNPRFDRLVGARRGALVGEIALERIAPRCHAEIVARRKQQDVDGQDFTVDSVFLTEQGEKAARLSSTMVKHAGASHSRIVHVHLDDPVATPAARSGISAAGRIQLIGLHDVRNTLGPRWPELAERAMRAAEQIIRQRLGPSDTVTPTDDQGFMVYFEGLAEAEAASRAVLIGQEIRARLIGQGESAEIAHVQSVVIDASSAGPAASRAELELALQARVNQSVGKIQQTARAELRVALAQSDFQLDPVYSQVHDTSIGMVVKLPTDVERMIQNALGVLPAIETKAVYIDAIRLGFARYSVIESMARGASHLVFVTLSNEVFLSVACLNACVEVCRSIAITQRQRLVINVTASAHVSRTRTNAVVEKLRGFCRFVAVTLPTIKEAPPDLVSLKVSLVAVEWQERSSLGDWTARLLSLAERLRNEKCRLMVLGAPAGAVTGLFKDGADFVSEVANKDDAVLSRLRCAS